MCSLCTQSTLYTPHFRHLYELAHRRYGSSGSSCASSSNGVDAAALKLGELHLGFGGAAGGEGAARGGESKVNAAERHEAVAAVPVPAVPAPAVNERESGPVAASPAGPSPPPDWAAEALAFDSVEAWFHEVSLPPSITCGVMDPLHSRGPSPPTCSSSPKDGLCQYLVRLRPFCEGSPSEPRLFP